MRVITATLLLACLAADSSAKAQPTAAGFDFVAQLDHAANRVKGAPSVAVHAPPGFDPRGPLELVVFLHGYNACVGALMGRGKARCKAGDKPRPAWDLGGVHDAAHTQTLFVVPQLAYLKRDGDPGAFAREGGFAKFIEELLAGPLASRLGGARSLRDVTRIDLVAHSGGYRAALAILEHGGISPKVLRSVVLLDALYGEMPRFAEYIERHRDVGFRFVSISLAYGVPERQSGQLYSRLQRSLGPEQVIAVDTTGIARAVTTHAIVIAEGRPPHRLVPETHLAEVLAALHSPVLEH